MGKSTRRLKKQYLKKWDILAKLMERILDNYIEFNQSETVLLFY